jgi:glutaredoxin-like protein NrdH
MTVEVYSKPSCIQCTQSKKRLEQLGIEYVETDIFENPDAYKFVTETLKFKAAPVIVIKNPDGTVAEAWSGFNPEKIAAIAQSVSA